MREVRLKYDALSHDYEVVGKPLAEISDKELNSLEWAILSLKADLENIIDARVSRRIFDVKMMEEDAWPKIRDRLNRKRTLKNNNFYKVLLLVIILIISWRLSS